MSNSMQDELKKLAFEQCKNYGNKVHKKFHGERWNKQEWNLWCTNCNDFLHLGEDVVKLVIKRLSL